MKNNQDIISNSDSSSAPLHPAPLPLQEDSAVFCSTIHPQHWQELAASAIDPEIAELNFVSLKGVAPYDYLFYSDGIKRLNTGRLPSWILKNTPISKKAAGGHRD
jgi:hypothetical protein